MMFISSFTEALFLYFIDKLNGERSIYAIYHLLKGKKSSQTIQDAHLFGVKKLFGTYSPITREQLEQCVSASIKHKCLIETNKENHFLLTEKGRQESRKYLSIHPLPIDLDGWGFQNNAAVFWGRLTLLLQSLSHIINDENYFYPIQRNAGIQNWVKRFFQLHPLNRSEMGQSYYDELVRLLEKKSSVERDVFVMRLTGSHRIGSTFKQISEAAKIDEVYVRFLFLGMLHYMIREITVNREDYPYLYAVVKDLPPNGDRPLTESARLTLTYIEAGKQLKEVAAIRRLKVNTIEDHIVEIVLAKPDFSITSFVSETTEDEIMETAKKLKTRQLKIIKNQLANEDVTFFQIRLVLARAGGDA